MALDRTRAALPDWARDGAVYQIYPRPFQDTDGDGIGDLPGILAHLDELEKLGVTPLWLSPIHPSPQADFGCEAPSEAPPGRGPRPRGSSTSTASCPSSPT